MRFGTEDREAVTTFGNKAAGHKALLAYLLRGNGRARVCLEASGNYSLDLALTLQAHPQVEVSVVNPRRARRFAESLGERSKTDPVDAGVLCEYAARMPWLAWQPPSSLALRLRAITRAIEALGVMHTQEKNREHALATSQALPAMVIQEMRRHQRYLEHRMERLRREALRLIARDRDLDRRFRLMLTVPGIAETSALQILGNWSCSPIRWMLASGSPSAASTLLNLLPVPRCKSGRGSAEGAVAICVVHCTCQRWWPFAASLICGLSINVCSVAAKHVSRQS